MNDFLQKLNIPCVVFDNNNNIVSTNSCFVQEFGNIDNLNLFKNKFDFDISLERPYKLCDFKPTYGYVFYDLIKDYKFWGHCDTDIIWGRIDNFITSDAMDKYDKKLPHHTISYIFPPLK